MSNNPRFTCKIVKIPLLSFCLKASFNRLLHCDRLARSSLVAMPQIMAQICCGGSGEQHLVFARHSADCNRCFNRRWRVKCSHRLTEFVQAASVNLNRCLTPAPIDGRPELCEIRQPKAWPHIDCSNPRQLSLNVAGQVSRARPAPAPDRQTHRATRSGKKWHNCNSSVDSDTSERIVLQTGHRSNN